MCRHLAYLGPPVRLSELLTEAPHSLVQQSWAPQDMRGSGTINADGFGVGWYTVDGPVRYRRDCPMWSDENLVAIARTTTAAAFLAAVRSATVGMPVGESACAPFSADGWLFSHNGIVAGWPSSVGKLAERLPVTDLLTLDAPTDSALVWALLRHRLRAGVEPAAALAGTVRELTDAAPGSRLNLLITDGIRVYATTAGHSLWAHRAPGRLVVASEPLGNEPGWLPVPDGRLVVGDPSTYTVEEL
jgi:glutamine amidotransferase